MRTNRQLNTKHRQDSPRESEPNYAHLNFELLGGFVGRFWVLEQPNKGKIMRESYLKTMYVEMFDSWCVVDRLEHVITICEDKDSADVERARLLGGGRAWYENDTDLALRMKNQAYYAKEN